jgi:hypothetical protein
LRQKKCYFRFLFDAAKRDGLILGTHMERTATSRRHKPHEVEATYRFRHIAVHGDVLSPAI